MKKLAFNRSKLLKAIRFCYLLLLFTASHPSAHAQFVSGANNTVTGSGTFSGYFVNTGSYTLTVSPGASISNAMAHNLIGISSGTITIGSGATLSQNAAPDAVVINTSGTVTSHGTITSTSSYAVTVNAGTVNNYGAITGDTSHSTLTGGINLLTSGSINNYSTGIITGYYTAVNASGDATVTNAGLISGVGGGVTIGGHGNVINSGTITGSSLYGVVIGSGGTVVNSGTITSTGGQGIVIEGSAASQVSLIGGTVSGNGIAVQGNGNTNVTVTGRSTLTGNLDGGGGGILTLNLVGVSPSQKAALEAALTGGTGSVTVGGQAYSWQNFNAAQGSIISLEQVVDSGLQPLAVKLDNASGLPDAFNAVYAAAAVNPEAALDEVSGREVINAANSIGLNTATQLSNATDTRAYDLRSGATGISTTGLRTVDPTLQASLSDTQNQLGMLMASSAYIRSEEVADAGVTRKEDPDRRFGAWVSGTVTKADQESNGSGAGYQYTTGSPMLGFDYRLTDSLVVGGLFNYSTTSANFADASALNVDTELFALYGTWFKNGFHVNGLTGFGITNYDSNRHNPDGSIAHGTPSGDEVTASLTGGYDFHLGGWLLSPEAGVQYTRLAVEGYTETGAGALDLTVGSRDVDSLRSQLGGRLSRSFDASWIKLTPEFRASWYHEFMDSSRGVSTSFASTPALGSFSVRSSTPQRDFALVGAGLSGVFAEANAITLFVNYDAQAEQDFLAQIISGGLRVDF